jgi:UV DNA damage endonuclease
MKDNVRLGYCCINLSLAESGITANRGMVKKTFAERGVAYAGELALKNLQDLLRIMHWNKANDIMVYRMSSDIFPWMSEYEITQLPNFDQILPALQRIGEFAKESGMRLSMHPGQFDVLCSPREDVVRKTIKDLNQHCQIMDLMGLDQTHTYPINIHIGGTYGDKPSAADRFCDNYQRLDKAVHNRLVVENDDKATQYSVADLYELFFVNICTPITFDYHHHRFNTSGLSEVEALDLAASTWPCTPLTHYSSCRRTFEEPTTNARAHADYVYEKINTYDRRFDIEVEAKAKDLAVLRYRANHTGLLESYVSFDKK